MSVREVAHEAEQVAGRVERVRDQAAGDHRADRVQPVLERRGDAEVAAAAAEAPEQVRMLVGAHGQDAPVGRHELDREQVVGGEAELRHQPAETAAERQAGDSRRRDRAARDGEAVELRLAVELLPEHAALRAHRPRGGIDVDALHRREVDHQPAVGDGGAGDVVPAAADRELPALLARGVDRADDVRRPAAAGDQRGPPVDQPVVDATHLVVGRISRLENLSGEALDEGDSCSATAMANLLLVEPESYDALSGLCAFRYRDCPSDRASSTAGAPGTIAAVSRAWRSVVFTISLVRA